MIFFLGLQAGAKAAQSLARWRARPLARRRREGGAKAARWCYRQVRLRQPNAGAPADFFSPVACPPRSPVGDSVPADRWRHRRAFDAPHRVAANRGESRRASARPALAPARGCNSCAVRRAAGARAMGASGGRSLRRPQGATEPSAGRSGRQATVAKPERVPTRYIGGEWENVFHQPDGVWCGGEWDERWGMSAAGGVARDGEMVGMSAAGTSPARNDRARRIVARLAAFCKPGERVLPVALPDEDTHAHGS